MSHPRSIHLSTCLPVQADKNEYKKSLSAHEVTQNYCTNPNQFHEHFSKYFVKSTTDNEKDSLENRVVSTCLREPQKKIHRERAKHFIEAFFHFPSHCHSCRSSRGVNLLKYRNKTRCSAFGNVTKGVVQIIILVIEISSKLVKNGFHPVHVDCARGSPGGVAA